MSYLIEVQHTFDAGHRVLGHQGGLGKCARLHGHTYGVVVTVEGVKLDDTGFVVDFGVVKRIIDRWDHRTLLWDKDPLRVQQTDEIDVTSFGSQSGAETVQGEPYDHDGVVRVPFNPTAEHMAEALAREIVQLPGVKYAQVVLSETPNTRAHFSLNEEEL